MLDVDEFWTRHIPGFQGLSQRQREQLLPRVQAARPDLVAAYESEYTQVQRLRKIVGASDYPGMGTGHPDLYKAFVWRFWNLVAADGGRIGVVLPRSAMAAKGSAVFREQLLTKAEVVDLTMLLNSKQWVFEEVHPQYAIGLVAITRRSRPGETKLLLKGPYASLAAFGAGKVQEPTRFYGKDVRSWNDTASLPLLPREGSAEVFAQLRKAPRLDLDDGKSWRARPIQGDLNATWGKPLMDLESEACPDGFWPVYKGESFDLWTPDTGTYYAYANPAVVLPVLQESRQRGSTRSAFAEFPEAWRKDEREAPPLRPRIAFRDITNRLNERTVIATLVPPKVFLTNKAPYLLWPRGSEEDQAYLLGVLASIPLDWYGRRFIERSLNFFICNPLPGAATEGGQRPPEARGRARWPSRLARPAVRRVGEGRGGDARPVGPRREGAHDPRAGRRRRPPLRSVRGPARPHLRDVPRGVGLRGAVEGDVEALPCVAREAPMTGGRRHSSSGPDTHRLAPRGRVASTPIGPIHLHRREVRC